jgi:hypothetical protein
MRLAPPRQVPGRVVISGHALGRQPFHNHRKASRKASLADWPQTQLDFGAYVAVESKLSADGTSASRSLPLERAEFVHYELNASNEQNEE